MSMSDKLMKIQWKSENQNVNKQYENEKNGKKWKCSMNTILSMYTKIYDSSLRSASLVKLIKFTNKF